MWFVTGRTGRNMSRLWYVHLGQNASLLFAIVVHAAQPSLLTCISSRYLAMAKTSVCKTDRSSSKSTVARCSAVHARVQLPLSSFRKLGFKFCSRFRRQSPCLAQPAMFQFLLRSGRSVEVVIQQTNFQNDHVSQNFLRRAAQTCCGLCLDLEMWSSPAVSYGANSEVLGRACHAREAKILCSVGPDDSLASS